MPRAKETPKKPLSSRTVRARTRDARLDVADESGLYHPALLADDHPTDDTHGMNRHPRTSSHRDRVGTWDGFGFGGNPEDFEFNSRMG